jgi:putative nucleotidyltransferase with HDIG domain
MNNKRKEALDLLNKYVKNSRMIAHCLASEVVMKKLAFHFGESEEEWGLCGLLHDIDVEVTDANPLTHGKKARELISSLKLNSEIIEAIERHNEMSSAEPRSRKIDYALAAGETITGLIFATAMVYPDKKISSVKPKSIVKRMKEKNFAASVKRENIMECEIIGISINNFATMSLEVLSEIETELGF